MNDRNDIHFYANSKDTSLVQLAVGLIGDLKLNDYHKTVHSTPASIVDDAAQLRDELPHRVKQTSDGFRTALGVYYITSMYEVAEILPVLCHC